MSQAPDPSQSSTLPIDPYLPLLDLLSRDDYAVALALAGGVDICNADSVAKALIEVMSAEGCELALLRKLIASEFERNAEHPSQILRQQSLATRAVGAHAQRVGTACLRETLSPLVAALAQDNETISHTARSTRASCPRRRRRPRTPTPPRR